MAQSSFTMRIDSDAKEKFSDICDTLGISMASAVSLFINTVNREGRIPFEISISPTPYNDVNAFRRVMAQFDREYAKDFTLDEINDEIRASRKKRTIGICAYFDT